MRSADQGGRPTSQKTLHRSHANRLSPGLLSPHYHHGFDFVDDALVVDPSLPSALGGANVSSTNAQRPHRLSWSSDYQVAVQGINLSGALLDHPQAATSSAQPANADSHGVGVTTTTSASGSEPMSVPRTSTTPHQHQLQHYHHHHSQLAPQYHDLAAGPDQLLQEEQQRQYQHRLFLLQHRQQLQQQYLNQHRYLMQTQNQRQPQPHQHQPQQHQQQLQQQQQHHHHHHHHHHFRSLSTPTAALSASPSRIEMVVAAAAAPPDPANAPPDTLHHYAKTSAAPSSSESCCSSSSSASTVATATTASDATAITVPTVAAPHPDHGFASITGPDHGHDHPVVAAAAATTTNTTTATLTAKHEDIRLARPESVRQRSSYRSIVSGSIDELLGGSVPTPGLALATAGISPFHRSVPAHHPVQEAEHQASAFTDPFSEPSIPELADLQLQTPHSLKAPPSDLGSPSHHSPPELPSPLDVPVASTSQAQSARRGSKSVSDAKVAKARVKKTNSSSQVIKLKDASHVIRREDDRGNVLGLFHVYKGFGPTPRKPSDPASRQAPRPKKISCTRCRRLKKACHPLDEPGACCVGCQTSNPYLLKGPSIKDPIVDAVLFRLRPTKGSVLEFKRPSVYKLEEDLFATQDVHQIELTQGFSGSTFSVFVKRFHPAQGDLTFYPWKDAAGQTHRLEMPPYCITFISDTRKRLHEYLEREAYSYLQEQLDSNDMDPVLRDVFAMAQQTSGRCTLAKQALDLWCLCRSIERLWRICGDDTLGVGPSLDPRSPYYGFVPVTPFMDQQLDQMIIQEMLKPLASQLLKNLQSAVNKEPKKRWFGIYTATAILLSNQERLMAHSRTMARRYSLPTKYSSFSSCEAFLFAANILLSHFHFVCGGTAPLSIDWRSDDVSRTTTSIDDAQINHLERVGSQMRHKQQTLEGGWQQDEYDADLFWVRQMWLPGWKPTSTSTSVDETRIEEMQL